VSIKTQETCKPVPPRWTTAKIQAEKRVCVLCVNPAICAVCAVLAVRSFNNLRWHNRGRGFESHPLRHLLSITYSRRALPACNSPRFPQDFHRFTLRIFNNLSLRGGNKNPRGHNCTQEPTLAPKRRPVGRTRR